MLTAARPATHRGWSRSRAPHRRGWLAAALAIAAVGVWACRGNVVDDAFITYRYSDHLARGFGPVWNIGADPVEGYTNFAWMVWHVPAVWLGIPLPMWSTLTAAACAAGMVWILVREPRTDAGVAVAVGSLVLFLPTWVHVDAGLETAPAALVVLRALVVAARVLRDDNEPRPWELPALLLLAGTLRPDAALAVVPAVVVWLRAGPGSAGWRWTGAAAATGVGYVAWRWWYFGHPLPNTFYVKAVQDAQTDGRWIQVTAALLLPLIVLACSLLLQRGTARTGLLALATVAALWVLPALTAPAMDYMSRFAWHAVPVLCLAAGWALDRTQPRRAAAVIAAVSVTWVAVAGVVHADARTLVNYGADLQRAHGAIGRGLAAANVPFEARTVAVSDAGVIPYESGWTAIDYIGLNDEQIAHGAPPEGVVTSLAPTVVVVSSPTSDLPAESWKLRPAVLDGYVPAAAVQMRAGYFQIVLVRAEYASQVQAAVDAAVIEATGRYGTDPSIGFRRRLGSIL